MTRRQKRCANISNIVCACVCGLGRISVRVCVNERVGRGPLILCCALVPHCAATVPPGCSPAPGGRGFVLTCCRPHAVQGFCCLVRVTTLPASRVLFCGVFWVSRSSRAPLIIWTLSVGCLGTCMHFFGRLASQEVVPTPAVWGTWFAGQQAACLKTVTHTPASSEGCVLMVSSSSRVCRGPCPAGLAGCCPATTCLRCCWESLAAVVHLQLQLLLQETSAGGCWELQPSLEAASSSAQFTHAHSPSICSQTLGHDPMCVRCERAWEMCSVAAAQLLSALLLRVWVVSCNRGTCRAGVWLQPNQASQGLTAAVTAECAEGVCVCAWFPLGTLAGVLCYTPTAGPRERACRVSDMGAW